MKKIELNGTLTKNIGLHYETRLYFDGKDDANKEYHGTDLRHIVANLVPKEGHPGVRVKITVERLEFIAVGKVYCLNCGERFDVSELKELKDGNSSHTIFYNCPECGCILATKKEDEDELKAGRTGILTHE